MCVCVIVSSNEKLICTSVWIWGVRITVSWISFRYTKVESTNILNRNGRHLRSIFPDSAWQDRLKKVLAGAWLDLGPSRSRMSGAAVCLAPPFVQCPACAERWEHGLLPWKLDFFAFAVYMKSSIELQRHVQPAHTHTSPVNLKKSANVF